MLDREKDEESAKPAPETAPGNDDPKSAAEPVYEPSLPTSKPPAPGLPGMPAIPCRIADMPPISRPAGDGTVSRSENTRMTVGKDVEMSGEIKSCDLLVVEGTVDATLQNGREIQIARSGRFSGLVEVEDADISGRLTAGDGHATEIAVPVEVRRAEEHEFGVDNGDGADGLTKPGVSET